jgi:ParB-like chromosome segregation protein Spo0J
LVATAKHKSVAMDQPLMRSIETLIPYSRNSRTHSETQIAQIAASLKEFGWTVPILIDAENMILAGHGRVAAARKLGIKEIPVVIADGWTESQKRAYVLADNKIAMNAGWDEEMLRIELEDIRASGLDFELTGFTEKELAAVLGELPEKLTDQVDVLDEQKQLLLVEVITERELEQLYEEMTKRGYKCKVMN